MHAHSREEEIKHAGTVCGWFSGDWVHHGRAHRQRKGEAVPILDDAAKLVGEADLTGLIDQVVAGTRFRGHIDLAMHPWVPVAPQPSRAEEAVESFATRVREIQAVDGAFFEEADEHVRVWTVMDEYDREAEDRVYAAEHLALAEYADTLFSFGILYRHGRPLDAVRPPTAIPAYVRA